MATPPANIANQSAALQLHDIHLPASPGIWPLAPGWWVLLALSLLILIWIIRKALKKAQQQKKLRLILSELNELQEKLKKSPSNEIIADINILLRKVAISVYPQQEVASLTGAEWLKLLDRSVKNAGFSKGAGRILVDAPYQAHDISNLNLAEFTPLIRSSIKRMLKGKIKQPKTKIAKTGGDVL